MKSIADNKSFFKSKIGLHEKVPVDNVGHSDSNQIDYFGRSGLKSSVLGQSGQSHWGLTGRFGRLKLDGPKDLLTISYCTPFTVSGLRN